MAHDGQTHTNEYLQHLPSAHGTLGMRTFGHVEEKRPKDSGEHSEARVDFMCFENQLNCFMIISLSTTGLVF